MRAIHHYAIERTAQFLGAKINMKARQTPLMDAYETDSEKAWIVDRAITSSDEIPTSDAIHSQVTFGENNPVTQDMGVHTKVGGNCDAPNPGELFAAAIASCLDTTLRIIANRLGLTLRRLSVQVEAKVDVRGTLRVDKDVPVGFQSITIHVDIDPVISLTPQEINRLIKAAEKSCVVLQTIKTCPAIIMSQSASQ